LLLLLLAQTEGSVWVGRDEVTGEWRKLYNGELHDLHASPGIIGQVKSKRMRWAGHVARMGGGRNVYRVLVGKSMERDHLKDQGVDGRMGSKGPYGDWPGGGGVWSGFSWLMMGTGGGLL
jgi:hypothetical protein